MIQEFLSAKHWQLFILFFALPMLMQFVFMGAMFSTAFSENQPDVEAIFGALKFIPLIGIIYLVIYFCWFWSLGVGLNKLAPEGLKQNVGRFKLALIFPIVYFLVFILFIGYMFMSMASDLATVNLGWIFAFIVPLHLCAMVCTMYTLYFIAKAFKTAELQEEVSFSDFVGEFFMFWFFPIGIWFLQPKINEMIKEDYEARPSELV